MRIECRAEGVIQVSRRTGRQYRRDKQQHHQHRQEGGVTGHATKHALGIHILAAGAVMGAAEFGVTEGEHQREQRRHHKRQEHATARLLDGKRGDHEDGTGRRYR